VGQFEVPRTVNFIIVGFGQMGKRGLLTLFQIRENLHRRAGIRLNLVAVIDPDERAKTVAEGICEDIFQIKTYRYLREFLNNPPKNISSQRSYHCV
jgi:homoserine dehydrogenase